MAKSSPYYGVEVSPIRPATTSPMFSRSDDTYASGPVPRAAISTPVTVASVKSPRSPSTAADDLHVSNPNAEKIKKGWLMSMDPVKKTARTRMWFVLDMETLTFYNSSGDPKEPMMQWLGWMLNDSISHVQRSNPGISFRALVVNMPGGKTKVNRAFNLLAENEQEEIAWFKEIYSVTDGRKNLARDAVFRTRKLEDALLGSSDRVNSLEIELSHKNYEIQQLRHELSQVRDENSKLRQEVSRLNASVLSRPSNPTSTVFYRNDASWV